MPSETVRVVRWLNRRQVAERLGVPATAVPGLASRGLIRVRSLPVRARYSAEDVDRLAAEGAAPAVAAGGSGE